MEILEAVTGGPFAEMRFSRRRKVPILGVETIVARQGVTGEVGYEFMIPTSAGKGHELWAAIRDAGRDFGLRELGSRPSWWGIRKPASLRLFATSCLIDFRERRGRSLHGSGLPKKNSMRDIPTRYSSRPSDLPILFGQPGFEAIQSF